MSQLKNKMIIKVKIVINKREMIRLMMTSSKNWKLMKKLLRDTER